MTSTELDATTPDARAAELLDAVRQFAAAALEQQAAGQIDPAAAGRVTDAAKAALDVGVGLAQVAGAEAAGQDAARDGLRSEVLLAVGRSAKKKRDATAEHDADVARAAALGLGAREIAERAGVAHGTVAAIVRRHAKHADSVPAGPADTGDYESSKASPVNGAA